MATLDDDTFRLFTEKISELNQNLGRGVENTKQAIDEEKDLNEAERFLRQKERKEREQAAEEIKKARQAEADAIWKSLSETERQRFQANELDAAALKLKNKENQDKQAYNDEVKKIAENQESTFRRRANYELESLGFQRDSQGKLHQLANERETIEKQLISDLQKNLDDRPDLRIKYGADAKNAKLALDQEKLYKQQLASMGRYVDSNNKIIDTTIKLNKEQEASLRKIKQENEARDKAEKSLEEFKDMFGKKGAIAAGSFVLTAAFDFLKAGVVGTYKGLIAYEDALLDGVRGQSVMAAMVSEQANAYADSIEKTGGGLVDFGATMMAVGVQVTLATGPIGLLAVAIGGLLAILGYASQAEAAIIRREAELNKKRAALEDEAYKNFLQLGEASMTGARGVTGMIDDLKRVGLTIKEFDKLNKILSANSKEIAMFGATTVDGAEKFIEVTGNLINDEMSKVFEKMGISQNAQMEHAQKFMTQQARLGLLQGKTTQDLVKGTVEYIKELDRVAALTGANRKEQEAAREAVMADRQTRAALYSAQQKVKENPDDQEAILRVKVLQDTIRIAANLRNTYGAEVATGYQQNIAARGISSPASAMAEMMVPELIAATKAGTVTGSGLTEAAVGIGRQMTRFADTISLVPDALNNIVPEFNKLADGQTIMSAVMAERAKVEAKGQKFDENKFIDAYRKAATDPKTDKDVATARKTQEEAIAKQTQLLNGQLGAGKQMLEASGMMGKAAVSMLDAGRKMYFAAFKDAKGNVEVTGKEIIEKEQAIEHASDRKKEAELQLKKQKEQGASAGEIKDTEKAVRLYTDQVELLNKEKRTLEDKKKVYEDIVAVESQAEAENKKIQQKLVEQQKIAKDKNIAQKELFELEAKDRIAKGESAAKVMADRDKLNKQLNKEGSDPAAEMLKAQAQVAKDLQDKKEKLNDKIKLIDSGASAVASPTSSSFNDVEMAKFNRQNNLDSEPASTVTLTRGQRNVQKAPEKAEGGVVPGTDKGTTVTVGEKGKPEAIVPLEQLKGMIGGSTSGNKDSDANIIRLTVTNDNLNQTTKNSDATITRLNVINNNLNQTNNKLLEANNKIIEISLKQLKLTDDNNKLLGIDGPLIKSTNALKATDEKLIVSMTNVTNMLPNVLAQIVSQVASGGGGTTGAAGAIPQASTPGGTVKASAAMLRQAGLIFNPAGDIQKDDGDIDPRLIEIAKQVQASIPGFLQFSGFNDNYHKQGQHSKGKAFDFTLNKAPSKEEGAEIVAKLKSLGLDYARDEYNDPSENANGGHIHGQLNAFNGGVFEPRPGGVHVNLAEAGLREAAVPLNPGEKIRVEKSEQENNPPRKDPLSTVLANDNQSSSNSSQAAEILAGIHDLMEDKFDSMISAIRDGNNISDKILKYSQT